MSYILDALNKSEKDRASNRMPGMRGQTNEEAPRTLSLRQIFGSLAALVIINCLGVYWYFGSDVTDQSASIPSKPDAPLSRAIEPEVTVDIQDSLTPPNNSPEAPTLITPASAQSQAVTAQKAQQAQATATVAAAGRPNVDITAHIYADDPALRMVKIDGVARHEGDQLPGGYRVLSITESGVVLGLGKEKYELNVVEDWQLVPAEAN